LEPLGQLDGEIDTLLDQAGLLGAAIGVFTYQIERFQQPVEIVDIKPLAKYRILRARTRSSSEIRSLIRKTFSG
jgi:hypothetical protein